MAWGRLYFLQLRFELLVSPGHYDDFQRQLHIEDGAEKFFNRPAAEAAGQLQDDGPIAFESLPGQAFRPVLWLAEYRMDGNAGWENVRGRHAPGIQVERPFLR